MEDIVYIKKVLKKQRDFFDTNTTKDINFRIEKLKLLRQIIVKNEDKIYFALKQDLNKSSYETYITELYLVFEEIKKTIKSLPKWTKPKKVPLSIIHFGAKSYTVSEPYGVCMIMSPWNYPFYLSIAPLIGAIAGGNCSILKLSEYAPNTSKIIIQMLKENFDEKYIYVVEGNPEINSAILNEKFDYIFFTGSVPVGKIVAEAAAKHLTPVTLELGGKSPCIIDKTANISLAGKRIVWGKFVNAGQTCVAPDYLLVHKDVKNQLISEMKKYIFELYGDNPIKNSEYVKIINEKHFKRLVGLINKENIIFGGNVDEVALKIQPTLFKGVDWESPIMRDEIFGPLLPIFEYSDASEIVQKIKSFTKPLALYLFSNDKRLEKTILNSISFGGGCINDTIMHVSAINLPFGGVGESGQGSYHGKASFDTFTHKKSMLIQSTLFDFNLRYPPYGERLKWLKRFIKS